MASAYYAVAEKGLLDADIDLLTDTIKVRAVADEDYTLNEADTSMTPVTIYSGSTDPTLGTKTTTAGVFDAADQSPAYSSLAIDGTFGLLCRGRCHRRWSLSV